MIFVDSTFFANSMNQIFSVDIGNNEKVEMTLIGIKSSRKIIYPDMKRDPFSLIFKCARRIIFPAKSYRMHNSSIGEMTIFISATGPDRDGILYQAIFN